MKEKIKSISLIFVATMLVALSIRAASTDSVTTTVTAENISVAVSDGGVAYGTITLSGTEDTTTNGVNDSQTATNDGNVTEDFNIMGAATAAWTLAATAGNEQYTHKFCVTNCDASPTWSTLSSSGYTQLANDVSSSGTQVFDLQIGVPTATATYTQQSATVTVQAVYYQ